jgi:hypothetical protein
MHDQPSLEPTPISDDAAEHLVDAYGVGGQALKAKAASMMTDAFLLRAYQRTDGEPGNSEGNALLAEIERWGLDV